MSDMQMDFADPANHERAARLAHAMYQHIAEAGLGGLPFADVAAAVAMVNGMLLSGAYRDRSDRDAAPRIDAVVRAMADHAALIADTHAAASDAERAARDHRAGLASAEALICASDRAFHAARRAERTAESTGDTALALAADRARRAYRAGDRG